MLNREIFLEQIQTKGLVNLILFSEAYRNDEIMQSILAQAHILEAAAFGRADSLARWEITDA